MDVDRVLLVSAAATPTRATDYCATLARSVDATVDILHVDDCNSRAGTLLVDERVSSPSPPATVRRRVDDRLGTLVRTNTDLLNRELARLSETRQPDLIVTGHRKSATIRHRPVDDIVDVTVRATPTPVLAVPPGASNSCTGHALVPANGTLLSDTAMTQAERVVTDLGLPAVVTYAVDLYTEFGLFNAGGVPSEQIEQKRTEVSSMLDRRTDQFQPSATSTHAEVVVVGGQPDDAVETQLRDVDVSCMVVSQHETPRPLQQLVAGPMERLFYDLSTPTLIVSSATDSRGS